jgi:hypothetical protein
LQGIQMGGNTDFRLRARKQMKAALPSRCCCCPQGLQQPLPLGHLQGTGR